jgi:ribosome-binding factor A
MSSLTLVRTCSSSNRIFGSRVIKAIRAVLENNDALFECLVKDAGISIRDIRMSPDNSKAYILWDTYKEDDVDGAERVLKEHMPELKRLVSKKLAAKRVPYLEFIGHHQDSVQQSKSEYERLQRALDRIKAS